MTTILLARHGETDWNRQSRWQGHADPPLNEFGREQARELAERLASEPISAVYSSDLRRAHETARIVAERLGLDVTAVPDLREVDVGEWSGLSVDEVHERFPAGIERWRAGGKGWDGGESYGEMGRRVVGALERIAASHPDETVLVISHGGAIRATVAHARGMSYEQQRLLDPQHVSNCEIVRVAAEEGALRRLD